MATPALSSEDVQRVLAASRELTVCIRYCIYWRSQARNARPCKVNIIETECLRHSAWPDCMHACCLCCPRLRNPAASPGLSSLNLIRKFCLRTPHHTQLRQRLARRPACPLQSPGRARGNPVVQKGRSLPSRAALRAARGSGAGTGKRTASDWLRFAGIQLALAIGPVLDIRSHPQQFSSHELAPLQPCTLVTVGITVVQKRWPVAHPPVGGSGPRNDHRQA